ncbi:MAG: hypothetical protein RR426_07765 [Oscillospiraceae bacterium]
MPLDLPDGFLNKLNNIVQSQAPVTTTTQVQAPVTTTAQIQDQAMVGDYYIQQQRTAESLEADRLEHQKAHKIGNVRAAVKEVMPQAYAVSDSIRMASEDMRTKKLHHSRGTALAAEDNHHVLEFDIAGSGFQEFRTEHKGIHGKGTIKLEGEAYRVNSPLKEKKESTISWYNREKGFKFFGWLPHVRTAEQIEEDNKKIRAKNEENRAKNALIQSTFLAQAGEIAEITHKGKTGAYDGKVEKHEHVRKKISADGKKTRINMAGPLAMKGASNSGEYSIENLRDYMQRSSESYLTNIFQTWQAERARLDDPSQWDSQSHEINLLIKGHSRGGVASVEGAMMIKQWIYEKYPAFENFVKFEVVQYDPVPGTGSYSGVNKEVNHRATKTYVNKKDKMRPLGASAETTVVYSMHSNHDSFFSPQQVLGAQRVILTPFRHDVGLDTTEDFEAVINGQKEQKAARPAYTDASTGEVYRSSGLNSLAKGVYMVDELNTLVKLTSYAQVASIMGTVLKDTKQQRERHATMLAVAKAWFDQAAADNAAAQ